MKAVPVAEPKRADDKYPHGVVGSTRSTTTIEMSVADDEGRRRLVLISRLQDISTEDAVEALVRARKNNPDMARHICASRVERTYYF